MEVTLKNEYFVKQICHFVNGDGDWDTVCNVSSVFAETLEKAEAIIELWDFSMHKEPPYIDRYFDKRTCVFMCWCGESSIWIRCENQEEGNRGF